MTLSTPDVKPKTRSHTLDHFMTTSLYIDPKLWKEVKTLAADRHLSLNKYVHDALVKYLSMNMNDEEA